MLSSLADYTQRAILHCLKQVGENIFTRHGRFSYLDNCVTGSFFVAFLKVAESPNLPLLFLVSGARQFNLRHIARIWIQECIHADNGQRAVVLFVFYNIDSS